MNAYDLLVIACIVLLFVIAHLGRQEQLTVRRVYGYLKEIERQREEAKRR